MLSTSCSFCAIQSRTILFENKHAVVFRDAYPVTDGHTLVISKRHVADFFELSGEEGSHVLDLVKQVRIALLRCDSTIKGFNVGVNVGEAAGQTIPHCHIHVIPRRNGDVENPRGGIRHVIPGKGFY